MATMCSTVIVLLLLLLCGASSKERPRCQTPRLTTAINSLRQSEAMPGEFPWHAALFHMTDGELEYKCGASLLNAHFVLTAAHCLVAPNNELRVKFGIHELDSSDPCCQSAGVKSRHVHPQYSGVGRNDIALLELDRRVEYTPAVMPVSVDASDDDDEGSLYKLRGRVPGWGYTDIDKLSQWLRMTDIPTVGYVDCVVSNREVYGQLIDHGMFCAGFANGTSVCNGDSGGGLVTFEDGGWVLRGIVTLIPARSLTQALCNTKQYALFTKVRYYREWIKGIAGEVDQFDGTNRTEPRCGKRLVNKQNLIVNGVRSYHGQWPWQAAILRKTEYTKGVVCGGTIISNRMVLTAAHCVASPKRVPIAPSRTTVQVGLFSLVESSSSTKEFRIRRFIVHEMYNHRQTRADIALLQMEQEILFDKYVQPACLPSRHDHTKLLNTWGSIAGWGLNGTLEQPDVLMTADLKVSKMEDCLQRVGQQARNRITSEGNYCALAVNGTIPCDGDSGGGMFMEQNGIWTVRGIITRGTYSSRMCVELQIFADTLSYIAWIHDSLSRY